MTFPDRGPPRGGLPWRVAGTCLWFLVVFVSLWALSVIVDHLQVVLIPLAIAVLLATLLMPVANVLHRHGVPRGLATAAAVLFGVALVAGLVAFVAVTLVAGLPGLTDQLAQSVQRLHDWLVHGPLRVTDVQMSAWVRQAQEWLAQHREQVVSGAVGAFGTLFDVVVGLLLVVFSLIFFVHDGRRIWRFLLIPFRGDTRTVADEAGRQVFRVLGVYARVTVLVAVLDAVGIGVGLLVAGVPLALPLAALVFLGAFVPILGAFVSGLVAVLVALASNGFVAALIVLAIVVGVQQLEGNVMHPFLTGGLVRLHPLAVLLSVTTGTTLAGVVGALLAVPVVTSVRAVVRTVADSRSGAATPEPPAEHPPPEHPPPERPPPERPPPERPPPERPPPERP